MRRALKQYGDLAWGLALLLAGLYTLVSLLSYDPSDPSWNTEIESAVRNLGGETGAILSDLFLQLFGVGAFLWCMLFVNWGRLKLLRRPPSFALGRSGMFVAGLLLLGIALEIVQLPGGAIAQLLVERVTQRWPEAFTPTSRWVSALILAGAALPLLGASIGLTWMECQRAYSLFISVCGRVARLLGHALGWSRTALSAAARSRPPLADEDFPDFHTPTRVKPAVPVVHPVVDLPVAPAPTLPVTPIHRAPPPPAAAAPRSASVRAPVDIETHADYQLPPLSVLADAKKINTTLSKSELEAQAAKLMAVLEEFGVKGEISAIQTGPVVTLYELVLAPGIKSSRVVGLADDIARSMSAISTRVAVIPGRNAIGIELPNETRQTVFFKELLSDPSFEHNAGALPLVLGKDIGGQAVIADLARMPHLLVAGTTGSGKSVGINSMILSLLYRLPPERCKFIMIDPKMLELSVYNDIPHLLTPVVTEPKKAVTALKWAVREMENRYRNMSKLGVRNITGYNDRVREAKSKGEVIMRHVQTGFDPDTGMPRYENQPLNLEPLPYIVVIVDEMADLMLVAGKDIEAAVQRLAQMARAAGIHLIMATQRPSVDVITGTIKANFPTRISFQVTSKIDSRTILGEQGAEQLLGMGDLLFLAAGGRTLRVHGPFVSDREVERIVDFLKKQSPPSYVDSITEEIDTGLGAMSGEGDNDGKDDLYDQAVTLILREKKVSTSFIQRHFQIGYNRAARIIDQMEAQGIISEPNRTGRREILSQ